MRRDKKSPTIDLATEIYNDADFGLGASFRAFVDCVVTTVCSAYQRRQNDVKTEQVGRRINNSKSQNRKQHSYAQQQEQLGGWSRMGRSGGVR